MSSCRPEYGDQVVVQNVGVKLRPGMQGSSGMGGPRCDQEWGGSSCGPECGGPAVAPRGDQVLAQKTVKIKFLDDCRCQKRIPRENLMQIEQSFIGIC